MTAVTAITTPETRLDDLTDQDYRDIYEELRRGRSLAEFCTLIQTVVHKSWWSQYETGTRHLNTERKNELRRSVSAHELAPDVAKALEAVTADATVWRVGTGTANHVIMLAQDAPETLTVSLNHTIHIDTPVDAGNASTPVVTGVTRHWKRWSDMPLHVLRQAIENRQAYIP